LKRNHSEIEDLDGRPENIVRFQSRHIYPVKLLPYGLAPTAFGHRHENEEERKTCK
jgi:hypothetical protein